MSRPPDDPRPESPPRAAAPLQSWRASPRPAPSRPNALRSHHRQRTMRPMTSRALTPWFSRAGRRRFFAPPGQDGCLGYTAVTRILEHTSAEVQSVLRDCHRSMAQSDVTGVLRVAHGFIAERVRPVYAVGDTQPVSRTLRRGRGSCSQRLAVLAPLRASA